MKINNDRATSFVAGSCLFAVLLFLIVLVLHVLVFVLQLSVVVLRLFVVIFHLFAAQRAPNHLGPWARAQFYRYIPNFFYQVIWSFKPSNRPKLAFHIITVWMQRWALIPSSEALLVQPCLDLVLQLEAVMSLAHTDGLADRNKKGGEGGAALLGFHQNPLVVIAVQKSLSSHYNNDFSSLWHLHCHLMSRNQWQLHKCT